MQVILDISANTHQNDPVLMRELIEAVPETVRHKVLLKTQYWTKPIPPNERTTMRGLLQFINAAKSRGYAVGTSVFDEEAVKDITLTGLACRLDFVKLPCRVGTYWLADFVPRATKVYASAIDQKHGQTFRADYWLYCVPEYPADVSAYSQISNQLDYFHGVSDHSIGGLVWKAARKNRLAVYECHYVLERSDTNPDAGPFAKTPDDLREMFA